MPKTRGELWPSGSDDVVPFVDALEQHLAEVNRLDAVTNFLDADGVLLERVGGLNASR